MGRVGDRDHRVSASRGRRACCVVALVAGLAAAHASAQVYLPRSMATQEGGASTALPFGIDQPLRMLSIYDHDEVPWSAPTLVSALDLRADNDVPNSTQFAAKQYIDMWVVMSTAGRTSATASTTFDDNHGLDRVVVYSGRLALPAQPATAQAPRPCNIAIPFSQPFYFDLSPIRGPQPRNPGLAVEIVVNLQPTGDYRLDLPVQCNSTITSFGQRGPACQTGRGAPLTIAPNSSIQAGDRITYTVANMPSMAPFVVAIGSQPGVGMWGQLPLPFPLASFGAPDCFINTDWMMVSPALADQAGQGQVSYPLPSNRNLVGRTLHAQALCRDLAANPFLHVTSLGVSATVCGPLAVARVVYVGGARAQQGAVSYGAAFIMCAR
ncbi:MAG: hypothetical protein R3F56_20580 [Planctomycetota bacterium]